MPELPDVAVYVERLNAMFRGERFESLRLGSPFVLRTVEPEPGALRGQQVHGFDRLGKRIIVSLSDELYIVVHLMIAGRLRLKKRGFALPKSNGLAALDFASASVVFTEASKKKRASIHIVRGRSVLAEFDRAGLEVLSADVNEFSAVLQAQNHTLKRALTDPGILSGIGNAYSDEILFEAKMSPFKQTQTLTVDQLSRLHAAAKTVLSRYLSVIREEVGEGFPDKVTAFRPDMAVHGRYGQPCIECGSKIQRIVYAENEANYCAKCQTGGKLYADRSLSRLLKSNWPKRIEDLEN